ncbi:MAG: hypothetical protein ABIH70_04355 [Chloroflexota bacterium]
MSSSDGCRKARQQMKLHTASEVISLARELENRSAQFYENLSQQYGKNQDIFLRFARENEKTIVQVERTYYGVISDAIEGGYAFDMDPDGYTLETELDKGATYKDALNQAILMENSLIKFYSDAAAQSKSLMADIPRTFITVAMKKEKRILELGSLFQQQA